MVEIRRGGFSYAKGNNRYMRYWPAEWKAEVLESKRWEIDAWARDRQIPVSVVEEVVVEAMRLGRIPDMSGRGLSYDDSEALAHFVADAFLNMEDEDEIVTSDLLDEARRSSKKEFVRKAFAKRGVVRMPAIDKSQYPPIRGMEGPFRFRDGRILYYDPKEGQYYDRKSDMYVALGEDLEESYRGSPSVDPGLRVEPDYSKAAVQQQYDKLLQAGYDISQAKRQVESSLGVKIDLCPRGRRIMAVESTDYEMPVRVASRDPIENAYMEQFKRLVGMESRNPLLDRDALPVENEEPRLKIKTPTGARLGLEMAQLKGDPIRYGPPPVKPVGED